VTANGSADIPFELSQCVAPTALEATNSNWRLEISDEGEESARSRRYEGDGKKRFDSPKDEPFGFAQGKPAQKRARK
jgi:hypothetical protein